MLTASVFATIESGVCVHMPISVTGKGKGRRKENNLYNQIHKYVPIRPQCYCRGAVERYTLSHIDNTCRLTCVHVLACVMCCHVVRASLPQQAESGCVWYGTFSCIEGEGVENSCD